MTDTEDTAARPPMFAAPMDDERRRFLLLHLPKLSGIEKPSPEAKQLGEEGLVWLVKGQFHLTEKGRKLLEAL
jgi:hypothetical protein